VNDSLQDVSDTVAAVRNAVQSVRGSVEDGLGALYNALDIRCQTARHPGLMFGGSIALGVLGGYLLGKSNVASQHEPMRLPAPTSNGATEQREPSALTPLRDRGWLDEIAARFRPELEDLKGHAKSGDTARLMQTRSKRTTRISNAPSGPPVFRSRLFHRKWSRQFGDVVLQQSIHTLGQVVPGTRSPW
jgi:hypothetical protein